MPWNQNGGGPWGSPPEDGDDNDRNRDRDQNPWARRGNTNRPGGQGPDMNDMFKKAREKFQQSMPPGMRQNRLIIIVVAVLVALIALSDMVYVIQPEERGLVLTFGNWDGEERGPGLHFKLPRPFQTVERVDTERVNIIEIGSRGGRVNQAEASMVTGDENLIEVQYAIRWRVGDAGDFRFNIREPEVSIQKAAESIMREVIAQLPVSQALTDARDDIAAYTALQLQELLDSDGYRAGVTIEGVELREVEPPSSRNTRDQDGNELDVRTAFNDVQQARQDLERSQLRGDRVRRELENRAEAASEEVRNRAEAYRDRVVNRARGEAARFTSVLQAYQSAPDVTRERLYLETMQSVLQGSNTLVLDQGLQNGLLPLLPLSQHSTAGQATGQSGNATSPQDSLSDILGLNPDSFGIDGLSSSNAQPPQTGNTPTGSLTNLPAISGVSRASGGSRSSQ